MALIKTKTPNNLSGKIISRPSGNCPYYLVKVEVIPSGKENDEVTDTAAFFAQYDLSEGDGENLDML